MSYYIAPFTFNFDTSLIDIDAGVTDIDCNVLYDAIKLAQASEEGILYDRIGKGSGLDQLGPGVQVGITVELLGSWQLNFAAGNYIARVAGGNLIGGPSGDPIAYSAGVQALLIQSANATVVSTSGSGATAAEVWGYTSRSLSTSGNNNVADSVLKRTTADTEASAVGGNETLKSLYGMVAQAVHNTQVVGTSLSVTKSNDTTVLGTRTVTTNEEAKPITGINSD
jgi:hypothetical protein